MLDLFSNTEKKGAFQKIPLVWTLFKKEERK